MRAVGLVKSREEHSAKATGKIIARLKLAENKAAMVKVGALALDGSTAPASGEGSAIA